MKVLNLLVFANGFDSTNRAYEIGIDMPSAEVAGQVVFKIGNRIDAIGFACHDQCVCAQPKQEPLHIRMYVMLVSKQFAQEGDKGYDTAALNAAIESLQLQYVEQHPVVPVFVLSNMRDIAVASAVGLMREQMMQQAEQQARHQQIATPRKPGLVMPG